MRLLGIVAFACVLATGAVASPLAADVAAHVAPAVVANDNRVTAGQVVAHELHLSLDALWGRWYIDGPGGAAVPMQAFAERGKAPQIPGPVIRVPVGTTVVVSVRNEIAGTHLGMHGLMNRPALRDASFDVPFGATREVRFRADAAGTYYYWGTTTGKAVGKRAGVDSQLNGAIVVDPPGARPHDRIFVIGQWDNVRTPKGRLDFAYEVNVINGRPWPHTERLSYAQGATVRWRWINTSYGPHPLHLHGFYFSVDSRGDGIADTIYGTSDRDRRVTELIDPSRTFSMTWKASRAGNWLVHCHLAYHTMAHVPLMYTLTGGIRLTAAQEDTLSHNVGMGGLMLAVSVHSTKAGAVATAPIARRIGLAVETASDNTADAPSFRYVLDENGTTVAGPGAVGPAIVLVRGVPVAIDVTNRTSVPTTVHWHGIELQNSYYDGAAGFSGMGTVRAPRIEPGQTFEARMTPVRAGTFIYHTHTDDAYQLRGGLAGPLIVVRPGEPFDPSTDHIFTITTQHASADEANVFVNGVVQPAPLTVKAGVRQRLRFINMTTFWTKAMLQLSSAGRVAHWEPIAVDGADIAQGRRSVQSAIDTITIGQTRDYTFVPARGQMLLQIWPDSSMPPVAIPVNAI
jgi:FtsP/CotA-like multicopper oxidase with cupredoxin domain